MKSGQNCGKICVPEGSLFEFPPVALHEIARGKHPEEKQK